MKYLLLDDEKIYLPTDEDLKSSHFEEMFSGWKNFDYDYLYKSFNRLKEYKGVTIGVSGINNRCSLVALVSINDELYRVHIENVMCEHCGKQSGISGTSGASELYFGCNDLQSALNRAFALPLKSCIHCNKPLQRRHTIWFENDQ